MINFITPKIKIQGDLSSAVDYNQTYTLAPVVGGAICNVEHKQCACRVSSDRCGDRSTSTRESPRCPVCFKLIETATPTLAKSCDPRGILLQSLSKFPISVYR